MSDTSSEKAFSPGEVVQLRSGGPFMTVIRYYEEDNEFLCGWFWSGRYQTQWLNPSLLCRPAEEAIQAAARLKTRNAEADRVQSEEEAKNSPTG